MTLEDGAELGPSGWVEISQDRIDGFAAATEDTQWIHTNRERAAEGPFGTTVAHGFLIGFSADSDPDGANQYGHLSRTIPAGKSAGRRRDHRERAVAEVAAPLVR